MQHDISLAWPGSSTCADHRYQQHAHLFSRNLRSRSSVASFSMFLRSMVPCSTCIVSR